LDPTPCFAGRQLGLDPDDADLRLAYALRYGVYCVECRFLDAAEHPDGLESDVYDSVSAHFGAFNLSHELVGYVRLVPPDAFGRLPWESRCGALLAGTQLPPRVSCAEISRLMVRADYRRRRGDTLSGVGQPLQELPEMRERRTSSPQILLALYRQMYQYSLAHGLRHWYAAMERPLARSLKRLNFAFIQIGEQADYFGPVAPYLADLRELELRLERTQPALLAWMRLHEDARG
jgi:N-acyl amino acid synthase of PEP-CTERM/exosortase system